MSSDDDQISEHRYAYGSVLRMFEVCQLSGQRVFGVIYCRSTSTPSVGGRHALLLMDVINENRYRPDTEVACLGMRRRALCRSGTLIGHYVMAVVRLFLAVAVKGVTNFSGRYCP